MSAAPPRTPLVSRMTVTEFLAWPPDPTGAVWQLIDGEPVAMAPASQIHGAIQSEISRLLGNHLRERGLPCRVIIAPGVTPRVRSDWNVRVPDIAVSCRRDTLRERLLAEPVMVVEILSPSNEAETWGAVWAYTTIPSVQEIFVVRSLQVGAELLRRLPDGTWPANPASITAERPRLCLDCIDAELDLADFYATTELGSDPA